MIDKANIYNSFLKCFRVALTNTSVYSKDHPFFIKSVKNLKDNIDELLAASNPLVIGITSDFLFFGEEHLKGEKIYEEVAIFFHCRKVKTISFKQGLRSEELIIFLTNVNLSPKDIVLKGGLSDILREAHLEHIIVEDLDYSQLLKSNDGEESGDIWLYLLKKSLTYGNSGKINELADSFQEILTKFKIEDLAGNEEIRGNITELFNYLKNKNKSKFSQCSKALTRAILKEGCQLKKSDIDKLRAFVEGLNAEDISGALLDQFQSENEVDPLSLNLFSKLVNREKHEKVAASLAKSLEDNEKLVENTKVVAGIRDLISLPNSATYESKVYHNCLTSILENITLGSGLCFDRNQVKEGYRFILLDLFILEVSSKRLGLVLNSILSELDKVSEEATSKYMENFIEALEEKKKRMLNFNLLFPEINKHIAAFAEKAIINKNYFLNSDSLVEIIDFSSLGVEFYLDEIFKEERISPYVLKLFFKFFPDQTSLFLENFDKKILNTQFVEKIMENLMALKPALSFNILKHIFFLSNDFVKIEVLKKMKELHLVDEEFLIFVLDKGDFLQRKQALLIAVDNSFLLPKIAEMLLGISNTVGLKGKIIETNLRLINEIFFPEAKRYLLILSKYRFFWNRNIRKKAKKILEKNGI